MSESKSAAAIKSFSLDSNLTEEQYRQCDNFFIGLSSFLDNTSDQNWLKWYGHEKPEQFGKKFANVADNVLEQYVDGCYEAGEHLEALEIVLK